MIELSNLENIPDLCKLGNVEPPLYFSGIHFDSRKIKAGQIFLARKGEFSDGHDFIPAALENGATLVIGESKLIQPEFCYYQHPDVLNFVKMLAKEKRKQIKSHLIGITGSVGKTSTKDCLAWLLLEDCYCNPGNYNNGLGLPVSLLSMPDQLKYGVFEMGISTPGEMEILADILQPDLMLITNIQLSHIGQFVNYEQLYSEKLKSASRLKEDQKLLLPIELHEQVLKSHPNLKDHILDPISFDLGEDLEDELLNKLGKGPFASLKFAIQAALYLGLEFDQLKHRLTQSIPVLSPLRMERRSVGDRQFLLDCYNASTQSYFAFLDSILDPSEWILVAADMLELGDLSPEEHRKVLKKIQSKGFMKIYLLGDEMHLAYKSSDFKFDAELVESKSEIIHSLKTCYKAKIALKGSRKFALESLSQAEIWEENQVVS